MIYAGVETSRVYMLEGKEQLCWDKILHVIRVYQHHWYNKLSSLCEHHIFVIIVLPSCVQTTQSIHMNMAGSGSG